MTLNFILTSLSKTVSRGSPHEQMICTYLDQSVDVNEENASKLDLHRAQHLVERIEQGQVVARIRGMRKVVDGGSLKQSL